MHCVLWSSTELWGQVMLLACKPDLMVTARQLLIVQLTPSAVIFFLRAWFFCNASSWSCTRLHCFNSCVFVSQNSMQVCTNAYDNVELCFSFFNLTSNERIEWIPVWAARKAHSAVQMSSFVLRLTVHTILHHRILSHESLHKGMQIQSKCTTRMLSNARRIVRVMCRTGNRVRTTRKMDFCSFFIFTLNFTEWHYTAHTKRRSRFTLRRKLYSV